MTLKLETCGLDECFWEELAELDPADACGRSGAEWTGESYLIRILGSDYLLSPSERRTRPAVSDDGEADERAMQSLSFIAVHYLLNASDVPLSGDLVAASELKGGKLFFAAGAHSPDFSSVEAVFSAPSGKAERAAAALGGRMVDHGDVGVEIPALPNVPITFVFWDGDEEFPASTSMLFDRSAEDQLPMDVVLAVGQETMRQFVEKAREEG